MFKFMTTAKSVYAIYLCDPALFLRSFHRPYIHIYMLYLGGLYKLYSIIHVYALT